MGSVRPTIAPATCARTAAVLPTPQGFEHMDGSVRPGIDEPPVGIARHNLLGRAPAKDAVREFAKPLDHLGIVHPPEVVNDLGLGTPLLTVPYALRELVVLDHRVVDSLLAADSQVHGRLCSMCYVALSIT